MVRVVGLICLKVMIARCDTCCADTKAPARWPVTLPDTQWIAIAFCHWCCWALPQARASVSVPSITVPDLMAKDNVLRPGGYCQLLVGQQPDDAPTRLAESAGVRLEIARGWYPAFLADVGRVLGALIVDLPRIWMIVFNRWQDIIIFRAPCLRGLCEANHYCECRDDDRGEWP